MEKSKLFFNFVLATCKKGGIGFEGKLPWAIPADMKHFKEITTKILDEEDESISKKLLPSSFLYNAREKLLPVTSQKTTKTLKNMVVMGRKTWDSIPNKYRPLPNRINVVFSQNEEFISQNPQKGEDFYAVKSFDHFWEIATDLQSKSILNEIFVIGGSQIYDSFLKNYPDQLKLIFLTTIEKEFKCDAFFELPKNFTPVTVSKTFTQKNEYNFDFRVLLNDSLLNSSNSSNILKLVNPFYFYQYPKHEELQYLEIIKDIIYTGKEKKDRTGVGTISKFGVTMKYDLSESFPLLTTKDTFWRGIAEELIWFIKGDTNAKHLKDKKVGIWDGNASRAFLDSIGLNDREEWDLGPVYGFQWRHFGAEYKTMHDSYEGQGVDQLKNLIEDIKKNPDSRRLIMSAWNPKDLKLMALPPCHILCQFYVQDGKLSLQMYQRSADMGLGVPFNIASYSLLLMMVAQITNLSPGEFVHVIGDAHVYLNHVDALKQQLERIPKPFPILKLNKEIKNIEDFKFSDFEIVNYSHFPKIKMEMAV